jgi:hypothetical protein
VDPTRFAVVTVEGVSHGLDAKRPARTAKPASLRALHVVQCVAL